MRHLEVIRAFPLLNSQPYPCMVPTPLSFTHLQTFSLLQKVTFALRTAFTYLASWVGRREIIAIFGLKLNLDLSVITLVNYFPVIVL